MLYAAAGLAAATDPYITSVIFCHDPVPRLTPAAVQRLRVELLKVDWAAQLKSSLLEAEYTQVRHVISNVTACAALIRARIRTHSRNGVNLATCDRGWDTWQAVCTPQYYISTSQCCMCLPCQL
jgi:hypothetical protein